MTMKLKTLLALFSTIALASCAVEPLVEDFSEPSGEFDKVIIRVRDFERDDNPATKTTLRVTDQGAQFLWKSGDIVGIYPDVGTQVRFPIVEGLGELTNEARFTGGGWAVKGAHDYSAYYPFIPDMDLDKTAVPVDYTGQVQVGNENADHLGAFDYMAAAAASPQDGEISFTFSHLGCFLMIPLTVPKPGEYKTLTLSCSERQFVTKGTVDITVKSPNVPEITPTEWSNEFVIHLQNVVTTEVNEQITIYALIAPVAFAGETITVNLRGDHADCETSFKRSKPFTAGKSSLLQLNDMVGGDVVKLENGHDFNEDIKTLVNGEPFIYDKMDYRIKSISFEVGDNETPLGYNYVDVSAPNSPLCIYAYWVPEENRLVIRTPSNKAYANEDASGMFNKLDQLTDIDFSGFDLTYTESVGFMFNECRSLVSLDLSEWNTGGVTAFNHLFMECKKLKNLNISNFDMTSAGTMEMMFGGCRALTSIDLSHMNTPHLADINHLFYLCESLESVTFGERFSTSGVSDFGGLFAGCKNLTHLDLSMFDFSNANNYRTIFGECSSLVEILGNIIVDAGDNVYEMYLGCSSLPAIDVSNWDVSETESLEFVFSGCRSIVELDVSNWRVGNVKYFSDLFSDCTSLEILDVSNWNTSSAEKMYRMFANCSSLTTLDVSNFITNNVTTFGRMFNGCSGLSIIDVSHFVTESVREDDYMGYGFAEMFAGCSSLSAIDLSSFSLGSAGSIGGMFRDCSNLETVDLSGFNTSQLIDLGELFKGCSSLRSVTFGDYFDTHYCENFTEMFSHCSSLDHLDLSFFNTSSARNMYAMFEACSGLQTLNISSFDTSHIDASMGSMFWGCYSLEELRLGPGFSIYTGEPPYHFAAEMGRDVEHCTIYCSQDFKNTWLSTEGIYGPDDKIIWLNCDTGEPLE